MYVHVHCMYMLAVGGQCVYYTQPVTPVVHVAVDEMR